MDDEARKSADKLARKRKIERINHYCWVVWIFGAALVFLSWGEYVPASVGWAGFVIGSIGGIAAYGAQYMLTGRT